LDLNKKFDVFTKFKENGIVSGSSSYELGEFYDVILKGGY